MSEEIIKRNKNGDVIYEKRHLHFGTRFGIVDTIIEHWYEYDEKNNWIYWKSSDGIEVWYGYKNGDRINITSQKLEEQEFLGRKKCSRFELMEL